MKDVTKAEWQKEARYLYLNLKEMHRDITKDQIINGLITVYGETMNEMIECCWKVYCIEKNIKPEDYEI